MTMMKDSMIAVLETVFNMLEVIAIISMLFMAFIFQIVFHELPCPLCLLQRVGFVGMAFGYLMNLRFGLRPSHYSISLISALFTSFVALRQIALHVIPGTGAYGDPLFGFHLYTWSFIISMAIVVITVVMMGIDRQYQAPTPDHMRDYPIVTHLLFGIVSLLVSANILSVLLECGFSECPEDPISYHIWVPLQKF